MSLFFVSQPSLFFLCGLPLSYNLNSILFPDIIYVSEVSPTVSLPLLYRSASLSLSLSLCYTHSTHTYPFKFSHCKSCVLQRSMFPRVQQSSHQADYALSFNLSALFVPLDHTSSTQTNPVFVQGFLSFTLNKIACCITGDSEADMT